MPINVNQVNEYVNLVLGNLKFKNSYNRLKNNETPMVLVEGATDEQFLSNVLHSDVACEVASNLIKGVSMLKNQGKTFVPANCKLAICQVVYGLSVIPAQIKGFTGTENWPLYGVVDKDFDEAEDYRMANKLFLTDTHDLETMLMSTDEGLIDKIEDIDISTEQYHQAEGIAFEMSMLRQSAKNHRELKMKYLYEEDGLINYAPLLDGNDINIRKFLETISERTPGGIGKEQIKNLYNSLSEDNRRNIDKNGKFTLNEKGFDSAFEWSFWYDINGHDLLSAIICLNENAYNKYYGSSVSRLNREFEKDLIKAYDYTLIKSTTLYKRMRDAGLVGSDT